MYLSIYFSVKGASGVGDRDGIRSTKNQNPTRFEHSNIKRRLSHVYAWYDVWSYHCSPQLCNGSVHVQYHSFCGTSIRLIISGSAVFVSTAATCTPTRHMSQLQTKTKVPLQYSRDLHVGPCSVMDSIS